MPLARTFGSCSWEALGSYAQLVVADDRALGDARRVATELLADVDRSCSRFRPDAELVAANRAAGRWSPAGPTLVAALTAALEVAAATGGLVDPTLGADLAAAGYDADLAIVRRRPAGPDADTGAAAVPRLRAVQAWREVEVDPDGAVRVPAGAALDLGATAKAFAADLLAAQVARRVGVALVVSLGGDVATAAPGDEDAIGWQVDVAERPGDPAQERVTLPAGGLATSSTLGRRWRHAGRDVHHLLDPATGRPVEEVFRTVSVAAGSCLAANAASTAALVLGTAAPTWLAAREPAARLVTGDGDVVRLPGWPGRPC